MSARTLPRQLEIAELASSGVAMKVSASTGVIGSLLAWGTSAPSTASTYAPGALFIDHTNGLVYGNTGTYASPSFTGPKFGGRVDFQTTSAGLLAGAGTSSATHSSATAGNFLSFYTTCSAASGTARGLYQRLYLSSGAGGEAVRAFTTVSSNTPADTVNGAHISLNFGSSAGNVTGLGTAARCTLHIPNRSLTGTTAAVQAELYADGASSSIGGNTAFLRCVIDGNATGVASVNGSAAVITLEGVTIGSAGDGKIVDAISGDKAVTHLAKMRINGSNFYIMLRNAV